MSLSKFGGISERGYVNSLDKKGFTNEKCILELVANCLDGKSRYITFKVTRTKIKVIDNGSGMNYDDAKNMAMCQQANHSNENSRGVCGIGGKAAQSILSNKQEVVVYTRSIKDRNIEYWKITYPWDKIHELGQYTSMVEIQEMSKSEIDDFKEDRNEYRDPHGTTIVFPYSDSLKQSIYNQFNYNENQAGLPLDNIFVVFGTEKEVKFKYNHYEEPENRELKLYDYFDNDDSNFYLGKTTSLIDVYQSTKNKDDFRYVLKDDEVLEIKKSGRNYRKSPEIVLSGFKDYNKVQEFTVTTGLRISSEIFDENNTGKRFKHDNDLYDSDTSSDEWKLEGQPDDQYNKSHHIKDQNFIAKFKLFRNGQLITVINPKNSKVSSARASADKQLELELVQCHISYNPLSTQDNTTDYIMGIQENKNQCDENAFPIPFVRLLEYVRKTKADEIKKYFLQKHLHSLAKNKQSKEKLSESESESESENESESESESENESESESKELSEDERVPNIEQHSEQVKEQHDEQVKEQQHDEQVEGNHFVQVPLEHLLLLVAQHLFEVVHIRNQ